MCGIAGIVGTRPDGLAGPAAAMAAALVHRGPDGGGAFACPGAHLVHRRLAIIDPEGGRQPLANEDGMVQVVCNGEIYNHRELRAELEGLGHRFATASDCEVPVHAYEEWGDDCVLRLRGMFALAVLDVPRRRLLLARDQLGIKPLFWQAVPGALAFASELNALRQAGLSSWRPDPSAIDLFLRLQYIPSPFTAFQGVQRLAPAHRMTVTFDGVVSGPTRYWDCPYDPSVRPEAAIIEELAATVGDSVRAHLMSDVPFGALLSGGADSAGIVANMAGIMRGGVRTFTVGAPGPGDERAAARSVADHLGTDHLDEEVVPEPLALLPTILDGHGQPFGDDSAIPTWLVARLARRRVKMVLSGDGGDELFAGYGSYTGWLNWLAGRGAPPWRRAARALAARIDPRRFPARRPDAAAWVAMNEVVGVAGRRALWRPGILPGEAELPEGFRLPEAAGTLTPLALAQRIDLRTYLPDCVLAKVDAASMAHGLEVRTPLVDRVVAGLAMGIPSALQRDPDGRGKRLWRATIAARLPAGHLDRPKRGFAAPLARWCDEATASGQEIRRRITDPASPLRDWFEERGISGILGTGTLKQRWLLLVLDQWLHHERKEPAAGLRSATPPA